MSSPPSTPVKRPRRLSRFTEGSETTLPSTTSPHSETYTQPLSLLTILNEMDDYEQRLRKRGNSNSNSSVESFGSSTASSPKDGSEDVGHGARRSGTWNGRRSEDIHRHGHLREREGNGEGLASKVKGRLRAFTGERRRDIVTKGSPYPGT